MELKLFEEYLLSRLSLRQNHLTELKLRTKKMSISRNSFLVLPGEVSRFSYFIAKGFFRNYLFSKHEERTIDFFGPGQMCVARNSYFRQEKSDEGIICEKDAIVFRISFHDWRALEDEYSDFIMLTKRIIIEDLLRIHQVNQLMRGSSTRERFLMLKSQYPDLSNIVSQRHIASYLGVSDSTMSSTIRSILRKQK